LALVDEEDGAGERYCLEEEEEEEEEEE